MTLGWAQLPAHAVDQYRARYGARDDLDPTPEARSTSHTRGHASHRAVPAAERKATAQPRITRSDDDREVLSVLLAAHHQLIATTANHTNQLRALLLDGDETDRKLARGRLPNPVLAALSQRANAGGPGESGVNTIEADARAVEVRHLAVAVHEHREQIADNLEQLRAIVSDLAPHLTHQHRVGPIKAAEIIISSPPRAE